MKEILGRIGWSQRHFAQILGVSEDAVTGWCRGRHKGPGYQAGMRYLEVVARFLGV